jgi:hypothetical protein
MHVLSYPSSPTTRHTAQALNPDLPYAGNMVNPAPLLTLPVELQFMVAGYLSPRDSIYLKLTCHHFHTIIPPLTYHQLLEAKTPWFGREERYCACGDCLRLRPTSKFADNMLFTSWNKWTGLPKDKKRFCVECGLKGRYARNSHIAMGGVHHVFCDVCGQLEEIKIDGYFGVFSRVCSVAGRVPDEDVWGLCSNPWLCSAGCCSDTAVQSGP